MKKFDVVQLISIAGGLITAIGGLLTTMANDRRLEQQIDEAVTKKFNELNGINDPFSNE